jgi:hypothetical protein
VTQKRPGHYTIGVRDLTDAIVELRRNPARLDAARRQAQNRACAYDVHQILPKLLSLLAPRANQPPFHASYWEEIKNRPIGSFIHLFHEQARFFLHYYGLAAKSYLQLFLESRARLENLDSAAAPAGRGSPSATPLDAVRHKEAAAVRHELIKYLCTV